MEHFTLGMERGHPSRFDLRWNFHPERIPVKIATVGLANKTARIAWAVMTRKEV